MILFLFLFKKFIDLILLESLEDYFENTPKEILDNDWKEIEYLNEVGPSVVNIINQYMTPTKDQQAQEYAEKVNYPCPDYNWYESDDEQMKECLAQVWLDGYIAAEQSMWRSRAMTIKYL